MPRYDDDDGPCSELILLSNDFEDLKQSVNSARDVINDISNKVGILNANFEHATAEISKQWDAINKVSGDCKEHGQEAHGRDDKIWGLRTDITALNERIGAFKKRLDSMDTCIVEVRNEEKELLKMTWKQIGVIVGASAAIGAIIGPIVLIVLHFI